MSRLLWPERSRYWLVASALAAGATVLPWRLRSSVQYITLKGLRTSTHDPQHSDIVGLIADDQGVQGRENSSLSYGGPHGQHTFIHPAQPISLLPNLNKSIKSTIFWHHCPRLSWQAGTALEQATINGMQAAVADGISRNAKPLN